MTKTKEKTEAEKKVSVNFTLTRFTGAIKALAKAKMITEEEKQQLIELHSNLVERWISKKLEL